MTGTVPVSLQRGLMRSVGFIKPPHLSHWSPRASCKQQPRLQTFLKVLLAVTCSAGNIHCAVLLRCTAEHQQLAWMVQEHLRRVKHNESRATACVSRHAAAAPALTIAVCLCICLVFVSPRTCTWGMSPPRICLPGTSLLLHCTAAPWSAQQCCQQHEGLETDPDRSQSGHCGTEQVKAANAGQQRAFQSVQFTWWRVKAQPFA